MDKRRGSGESYSATHMRIQTCVIFCSKKFVLTSNPTFKAA